MARGGKHTEGEVSSGQVEVSGGPWDGAGKKVVHGNAVYDEDNYHDHYNHYY